VRYAMSILPFAMRQINGWALPDFVFVDVYLQLNEVLPSAPTQLLLPNADERDGMLFYFSIIDPQDRLCEHSFLFRVFFSQDETKLIVASGTYRLVVVG